MVERLMAAALIRNGIAESRGFKSHWEIRAALGDEDPQHATVGDREGFMTDHGRFVDRQAAKEVGVTSGQLNDRWRHVQRDLLSSDVW